jgi:hypothetical protein
MKLYLQIVKRVSMIRFSIYIADRGAIRVAPSCNFPMHVVLWSIFLNKEADFLSDLVFVAASSFVDTLMPVDTQTFAFTLGST